MEELRVSSELEEDGELSDVMHQDFVTGLYDEANDFDFVLTSYETGYEKPNPKIFSMAEIVPPGIQPAILPNARQGKRTKRNPDDPQPPSVRTIHVGDEYEKDIVLVKNAKRGDGILLDRDGKWQSKDSTVTTVQSLEELAGTIGVLLYELARKGPR